MCCFTGRVAIVSDTNIFARAIGARQILAYEMIYGAVNELAMVLPLPVPPGSPEDAVSFISLEECPDFFEHLRDGFPQERALTAGIGSLEGATLDLSAPLAVVEVGDFEASFVPSPEDFGRLDERFRLPADLWLQLNTYRDWGFAVFKLKATKVNSRRVHPMAFSFPRRDLQRLFFPTLHIHRASLEPLAYFDHMLYCQPEPAMNWHLQGWEESWASARRFVKCEPAKALFDLEQVCWRLELRGRFENADTWLGREGRVPVRA